MTHSRNWRKCLVPDSWVCGPYYASFLRQHFDASSFAQQTELTIINTIDDASRAKQSPIKPWNFGHVHATFLHEQRCVLFGVRNLFKKKTRKKAGNTLEKLVQFSGTSFWPRCVTPISLESRREIYRVVQKTVPQFYFCDNFRKWTPILTIFSLLEPEIYDA